jgi:hypothetical protein
LYIGARTALRSFKSAPATPKTQVRPKTHSERITDIKGNPQNWQRVYTGAEKATSVRAKGGISIDSIYRNKITGDAIRVHDVYKVSGSQLKYHPTYKEFVTSY